jgi:hypothetical protein
VGRRGSLVSRGVPAVTRDSLVVAFSGSIMGGRGMDPGLGRALGCEIDVVLGDRCAGQQFGSAAVKFAHPLRGLCRALPVPHGLVHRRS